MGNTKQPENIVPQQTAEFLYRNPPAGPRTQAERLFAKFGGVPRLHRALADAGFVRNISSIYRWNLPREAGGTGGIVPGQSWPQVHRAARYEGIVLTSEDMDPRKI